MTGLEHTVDEIFQLINQIRTDPLAYSQIVNTRKQYFHNDIYNDGNSNFRTMEGPKAIDHLQFQLNEIPNKKLPALKWSFALHVIADDQAQFLGSGGKIGHQGAGGMSLTDRVNKYSMVQGRVNELISVGTRNSRDIVDELLIDDGLTSRKRRRALLDPVFKYIGAAIAVHSVYGYVAVIVLADNVQDLIQPNQKLIQLERTKGALPAQQLKPQDPHEYYRTIEHPAARVYHVTSQSTVPPVVNHPVVNHNNNNVPINPTMIKSDQTRLPSIPSVSSVPIAPQQGSRCSIM